MLTAGAIVSLIMFLVSLVDFINDYRHLRREPSPIPMVVSIVAFAAFYGTRHYLGA